MSEPVKRRYSSRLRAAQASDTRRRIVAAAERLFVEHGYAATTIDAVAAAAGVSRKTVFTSVGGKVDLLRVAMEWAVAGDDAPVGLVDRDEMRGLLAEADAATLLRKWASVITAIDARTAGLFTALEVAAGTDDEARELAKRFERQRLDGARRIVDRLAQRKALNRALKRAEAVDVAWLSIDPVLYDRLVRRRGWPSRRFETWLGESLCRQLLHG
ncbi:TetR family transcriptional regulator [Mycolicibacterium novocastrense]|uniref:TetR/AcrR family transcriptional regulator n=1 Tax=Mycolicibacterium novocastrense TaxID=59813 RepID=UPI000747574F|nr:TetR/AcrR family transcriptional regulator [Mycolicibacterium novocastrense]KUH75083.1 TetR family transcriptional regulator [Mycolicibacterium novocastrense]KUH77154.1 TetR family transcriptional regulator [Mycolicibacterium novocastrense]KUH77465.1 TetR family transcriptional regulator [Mycolicibacterium novocastrense]